MTQSTNNLTLTTPLNASPYYDDYKANSNFYRILFNPGQAVQARELTQMQTMGQKQLDRFAEHIFIEGSFVTGGQISYNQKYDYVKIRDADYLGNPITISNFSGTTLTGANSGVTAEVVGYLDGTEDVANTKTLYIQYTSAGSNNISYVFLQGERINANNSATANVLSSNAYGLAASLTVQKGVLFAKDYFVDFDTQTILLDRYVNTPNCKVGFIVNEEIITHVDDATLNDPAAGAHNHEGPGADRLKLTATLTKVDVANTDPDFILLYEIEEGITLQRVDKPQYSVIKEEWARRTFDESGNYVVNGLNVRVREHLNDNNGGLYVAAEGGLANTLAVGVESGKGVVLGYDFENIVTRHISVDKGIDYEDIEQSTISANYGRYVFCNEIVGSWDVNNGVVVSLYDTAQNAITDLEYSTITPSGSVIGTAVLRAIKYESGTQGVANSQYRFYLHEVKMTGNTFNNARSIYYDDATYADGVADIVLQSGNAQFYETEFDNSVFKIPVNYIRSVRDSSDSVDTTFTFTKKFNVSVSTGGIFSVSTGVSGEIFPYSTGVINDTQARSGFTVSLDAAATVTLTGNVATTSGSATVSGLGTAFTTELAVGQKIQIVDTAEVGIIQTITDANTLVLTANLASTDATSAFKKQYYAGDILDFAGAGSDGVQRTIDISASDTADFDMQETLDGTVSATVICDLNRTNAREIAKTMKRDRYVRIDCSTHYANNTGPWPLGLSDAWRIVEVREHTASFSNTSQGTDVTRYFKLDTGQTDNTYEHGKIRKLKSYSGLAASDHLLVKLDYFEHNYSQGVGYFSVDSYPIDDINGSANTNAITTKEIPLYTSTKTDTIYDLRDCFDTRKSKIATANDATTVSTSTTNPANTVTYNVASGGIHTPVPNENFIADLSYYLRRKDVIVIKEDGSAKAIRGVPSLYPITPPTPSDSMALAVIELSPYPSLPPDIASAIKRPDLASSITKIKNRRYTMNDIGTLDHRISNVEYYISLSLAEKETVDMKILDSDGLDRFKNGIIVDPFSSHKIGDTLNADYKVSIDAQENELRPQYFLNDINLEYDSSVNMSSNNNLLLLPYTEKVLVRQKLASTTRNAASLFYNFRGVVELTPEEDFWVDTTRLPDLQVDFDQNNQAWQEMEDAWNSIWNSWQVNVTGVSKYTDPTTGPTKKITVDGDKVGKNNLNILKSIAIDGNNTNFTLTKSSLKVKTITEQESIGDRVVDTSVIPYIRPQFILFFAYGLKPNAKHYAFFDNEDIAPYVRQTETDSYLFDRTYSKWGNVLVSDDDGSIYGVFRIPGKIGTTEPKFYVGTKNFRITDSITNSASNAQSLGDAQFHAYGINQDKQETIISTTRPQVTIKTKVKNITIKKPGPIQPPPSEPPPIEPPPSEPPPVEPPPTEPPPSTPTVTCDAFWQAYLISKDPVDLVAFPTQPNGTRVECCHYYLRKAPEAVLKKNVFLPNLYAHLIEAGCASSQTFVATNNDETGAGGGNEGDDPIGETVFINLPRGVEGCFLTSADLYFESKHSKFGAVIELREVDPSGAVLPTVLPNSRVRLRKNQINTSTDGSLATNIPFKAPVFVMNKREYCLVIRAIANNPNTNLWTAKLGEKDISTNERITKQPYTGVLYISSNNRTWQPEQEEDLKFTLYRAKFDVGVEGTANFSNDEYEFMRVANTSSYFGYNGEVVRGEPRLTLSGITGGSISNGEFLYGNTSLTLGQVSNISGAVYRVRDVPVSNNYTTGEPLIAKYANGDATGVTATLSSKIKPTGILYYYEQRNLDDTRMYLKAANNTFAVDEQLYGLQSNNTAFVEEIINIYYNVSDFEPTVIDFASTHIEWKTKVTSNAYSLSANWNRVNVSDNQTWPAVKIVASKSNEVANLSGNKSLQYQVSAYSTNEFLSPMIDKNKIHSIAVGNIINNDSTGEDSDSGGNALARYITKKVTLADGQDAEDLKIFLTAYRPPATTIKVYYKILHSEDSDDFDDISWVEMSLESKLLYSDIDALTDFKEHLYTIADANLTGTNSEVQYTNSNGIIFTGFKYFSIKIVLLSPNTSRIPRLQDMRGIALQK